MSRTAHSLPPVLYVFGDESGSFANGDAQVVGVLLCRDPNSRRAEIAALRSAQGFARELKFSDRDKFRLPYALGVLNWFFETAELEFRCIVKMGADVDLSYFRNGWRGLPPETLAYNSTYKELIQNNLPAGGDRLVVKVDERTRNVGDNMLDYLKDSIPTVRSVTEADSKTDDLLQVADLLVGSVHGAVIPSTGPIQRAISETFLRGCGLQQPGGYPSKVSREKVNIWRWQGRKRAASPP